MLTCSETEGFITDNAFWKREFFMQAISLSLHGLSNNSFKAISDAI